LDGFIITSVGCEAITKNRGYDHNGKSTPQAEYTTDKLSKKSHYLTLLWQKIYNFEGQSWLN
jgi:hypothetical protein